MSLKLSRVVAAAVCVVGLTASGFIRAADAPVAVAKPATSFTAAPDEVVKQIKANFPGTTIDTIYSTPIAGLYAVKAGRTLFFAGTRPGHMLLAAALVDLSTQQDVLAEIKPDAGRTAGTARVEFPSAHLANAIKTVRGTGERQLAVFADPDCGYCAQLEGELAKLDNVTIHLFLFPLDALHPQARTRAVSVWCSADRAKAWSVAVQGQRLPIKSCDNPVAANIALGQSLGVRGTPTLIAADGRVMPGAAPAAQIERFIAASTPVARAQ